MCFTRCYSVGWFWFNTGFRPYDNEKRVEMALREVVRAKRPLSHWSRRIPVVGWGLAAAAPVTFFAVWFSSHELMRMHTSSTAKTQAGAPGPVNPLIAKAQALKNGSAAQAAKQTPVPGRMRKPHAYRMEASQRLQAAGQFVALPYSAPVAGGDDVVVMRVQMQRAALGALGLPVNEERAAEWIQVDLLVGADGQPQAVRFLR